MSEWKPIETAPKDGTTVDLWCKRSWEPPETHVRSVDMYWCKTHNRWRKRGNEHFVEDAWVPKEGYAVGWLIPEFWMPLPEPPK